MIAPPTASIESFLLSHHGLRLEIPMLVIGHDVFPVSQASYASVGQALAPAARKSSVRIGLREAARGPSCSPREHQSRRATNSPHQAARAVLGTLLRPALRHGLDQVRVSLHAFDWYVWPRQTVSSRTAVQTMNFIQKMHVSVPACITHSHTGIGQFFVGIAG
ncbi:hypothetical protein CC80DRAFT_169269 [Byssothecium circinans]|uniref:Uncharacterized protein n=1 Tax=Byssothecium circinans TaxID=147558 RepID=A0A6A5TJC0_9PLEO|nr:hypothetical protein CC80DRAFT_169269 [Byssothecium circinans]